MECIFLHKVHGSKNGKEAGYLLFEKIPAVFRVTLSKLSKIFFIKHRDVADIFDKLSVALEFFSCTFHGNPLLFFGLLLRPQLETLHVLAEVYDGVCDDMLCILHYETFTKSSSSAQSK